MVDLAINKCQKLEQVNFSFQLHMSAPMEPRLRQKANIASHLAVLGEVVCMHSITKDVSSSKSGL
jgi:hypothetical protein